MMNGQATLSGLVLALAGFALHTWPRRFNRYFGVDSWRNLAAADYVRRGLSIDRYHEDRYLIPGSSDYPPVFRTMVAAFPKRFIERFEWAVGPLCDLVHSLLLFHIVWNLTHNLMTALVAQLVHIASPLVMMENSSMSARPFASLLLSLALYPLVATPPGCFWWLPVTMALFFLTILFLTHRLAIQALWVLVLTFTVFDRTWVWLAFYGAGTILAALVSRGFYWRILRGQFAMFHYWRRNMPYRYAHQVRGLPSGKGKEPDTLTRLNQWVTRSCACAAVLAANPSTLLVPLTGWWLLRHPGPLGGFEGWLLLRLVTWGTALLVAGMLIRQVPALRIIGDGERYLDSAVLPTALVVAALWTAVWQARGPLPLLILVPGTLLAALGIGVYLQWSIVAPDVNRSIRPPLWRIIDYVNTALPPGATIASIPLHLIPSIEYFTPCRVLSTDSSLAHITHLSDIYPIFRKPVPTVMAQYGVEYLLINQSYVTLQEIGYPSAAVVCEADGLALIRTGAAAHPPDRI